MHSKISSANCRQFVQPPVCFCVKSALATLSALCHDASIYAMECHIDMRYWPLIGTTTTTFTLDTYPNHYIEPWANTGPCNRRHLFCPDWAAGNIYQLMSACLDIVHLTGNIFRRFFLKEGVCIFIQISLDVFIHNCISNNNSVFDWGNGLTSNHQQDEIPKAMMTYMFKVPLRHQWTNTTAWPSFCRRQSQLRFLEWKILYFASNFIEVCSQMSNKQTVTGSGRVLTWRWTDKPLSELIMILIYFFVTVWHVHDDIRNSTI